VGVAIELEKLLGELEKTPYELLKKNKKRGPQRP
jgi:hypothetical protein